MQLLHNYIQHIMLSYLVFFLELLNYEVIEENWNVELYIQLQKKILAEDEVRPQYTC